MDNETQNDTQENRPQWQREQPCEQPNNLPNGLPNNPALYDSMKTTTYPDGRVEHEVIFARSRVQCPQCSQWFANANDHHAHKNWAHPGPYGPTISLHAFGVGFPRGYRGMRL